MVNAHELIKLEVKPRINDISLDVLREFYEYYLYPFVYKYIIKEKDGNVYNIELRFDIENLCHLLGIESIVRKSVSKYELHNYRGNQGWENIKNGVLDIHKLKTINKRGFLNVKAKYVYFYLLPQLISNPIAIKFNNQITGTYTNIQCEILFYSKVDGDNAIIHLGLDKNILNTYYFPRTFFVEKVSNFSEDIYIKNQENVEVKVENRIILQ